MGGICEKVVIRNRRSFIYKDTEYKDEYEADGIDYIAAANALIGERFLEE